MKEIIFGRGAALIVLRIFVSSCGGTSNDPIFEAPPVLPSFVQNTVNKDLVGCTVGDSCNPSVLSGVVVKADATNEDAEIRFVTITDNGNDAYTYDDGERQLELEVTDIIGMTVFLEGPDGFAILDQTTNTYTLIGVGEAFDPDEIFAGVVGFHTDA